MDTTTTTECIYCHRDVDAREDVPAKDDDAAWATIRAEHAKDCEWSTTRAHRLDPAAVSLGRRGGSATSEAKADAARANGARGGRPPAILDRAAGQATYVVPPRCQGQVVEVAYDNGEASDRYGYRRTTDRSEPEAARVRYERVELREGDEWDPVNGEPVIAVSRWVAVRVAP